jgi:hypothetical protein
MKNRVLILLAFLVLAMHPSFISAQENEQGKKAALETIGVQGAAFLYNTYCLIGAINDGYVMDAWEKTFAVDVLKEQSDLLVTVSNQYDSLLASGYLEEDDSTYLVEMKEGCRLLKNEADCLVDYINSESEENRLRYSEARDAAWDKIAELLGLNDQAVIGDGKRGAASGTK